MFSRILIANRGEIALRIIRACRELGIGTVAVFSEADRDSRYLDLADEAICIGPAPASESYLKSDRIIAAAEVANVEAIHPGYGFLAENATFAEQCRESKIEFIGPSAESMRVLGDKAEARKLARKSKVPVVPGSPGAVETEDDAAHLAGEIGYPVMVKAAAGGGGRGMRIAYNEASLRTGYRNARAEADAAFGDGRLYVEKLIEEPRHVEVQILGDREGNVVHFYERDCTLQRRHQKLVEETPSPAIDADRREELCRAAVRLGKAAGYFSAGTVEFLVDKHHKFYFIEANARIQVEHPVTEMVTGHDLIQWQLRVAAGERIGVKQREITTTGAAIECRINAEDASAGFRPCPGRIEHYAAPGGPGVRVDSHMHAGAMISPYYDSLVGKLIVHARDRDAAIDRMQRALGEYLIEPVRTTIPFHRRLLAHPEFRKGKTDTGFVDRLDAYLT